MHQSIDEVTHIQLTIGDGHETGIGFAYSLRIFAASSRIFANLDPVPPTHWRRKRGGQLKTWLTMLKEDLARMCGPGVYGFRRWNRERLQLGITWTQDRQA